jgi:hypothetical protein
MTRFVPVTVLVMVLAAGRVASAQVDTSMLPNGAAVVFPKLQIFHDGKFTETEANSTERLHYFNLAHCNCAKEKSGTEQTFKYLVQETAQSQVHQAVNFWVGTSCADDTQRNMGSVCKSVASIDDIDRKLFPGGTYQDFNLYDVVNGKLHQDEACLPIEGAATIWAFVDTTGSHPDTPDYKTTLNIGTISGETSTNGVDTKPPPLPPNLVARPNESGIGLSWKPPEANDTDVAYYQALCATLDGSPARARTNEPQYVTTQSTCPGVKVPQAEIPMPTVLNNDEMAVTAPTNAFGALDPKYICGQANSGTATSLSIDGLENETPYQVILLAIDRHGNFQATYFDHAISPHEVTDFWEDLHGRGSHTEGGLCLLAETYGDDSGLTNTLRAFRDDTLGRTRLGRWLSEAYYATMAKLGAQVHGSIALRIIAAIVLAPAVAFALLWHWLTLPGVLGLIAAAWWLRRRRGVARRWFLRMIRTRSMRLAAGIAVITLGASRAHAGGYQPYWETTDPTSTEEQSEVNAPELVKWHAGVRVGPYVPNIDKQLGMTPGPYEQMFGGYRILPMLDVDRIVWSGFGQVGVGLSLGYMQKSARAFTITSKPTDDPRARSGDTNKFRLIPMEVAASYRFTWLDDQYGIPVVPYVRGGLAYYLWWVSVTDGSLARACNDGGMKPDCSQEKALGGSIGIQGSIGLAIRAERVDAATANSMRQSGIQHAGIYGELSLAKVDGFGSDSKLSVGDRTWFAGVDFEF